MKRIPIIKNGPITIIDPGFPEKEWKKTKPYAEASMKRIPPAVSQFHAMIKMARRIRTGILCTRNPNIIRPKDSPALKTSSENISIIKMKMRARIRGIQNKIFNFILVGSLEV